MTRRTAFVLLFLAATGCTSDRSATAVVPGDPFATGLPAGPPPARATFAPATIETAARVDQLGHKIAAANPQIKPEPLFMTIGSPEPHLSHKSPNQIVITEGMVRRCATEGQLAALLSYELGRLVSEREALASVQARRPPREPPMDVPVGNDMSDRFGAPDLTRQAELAKFEPERRRQQAPPPAAPDPRLLAGVYLRNAGYGTTELDAAMALLNPAAAPGTLEKQMIGTPPAAH
jgi:hypothetical protein